MISRPAPCNSFSTFRTSVRSEVVRYHLTVIMFNYDKSSIVWFINVLLEQKGLGFHESFPEDGTQILNSWLSLKKLLIIPSFWLHSLPPAPSCHHTLKRHGTNKDDDWRKDEKGARWSADGRQWRERSFPSHLRFLHSWPFPSNLHSSSSFLSLSSRGASLLVSPLFFLHLDPYFSFCSSW